MLFKLQVFMYEILLCPFSILLYFCFVSTSQHIYFSVCRSGLSLDSCYYKQFCYEIKHIFVSGFLLNMMFVRLISVVRSSNSVLFIVAWFVWICLHLICLYLFIWTIWIVSSICLTSYLCICLLKRMFELGIAGS